jgi:hypothetical protein
MDRPTPMKTEHAWMVIIIIIIIHGGDNVNLISRIYSVKSRTVFSYINVII